MDSLDYNLRIKTPSKEERKLAYDAYDPLLATIEALKVNNPSVEIDETGEKVQIPLKALQLLADVLKVMSEGKPFTLMPVATEVTTQAAAEIIGCSRPHLVKLLEEGQIPFTKIGKHRRVKYTDVIAYKKRMKDNQADILKQMMNEDEELGLYDL